MTRPTDSDGFPITHIRRDSTRNLGGRYRTLCGYWVGITKQGFPATATCAKCAALHLIRSTATAHTLTPND